MAAILRRARRPPARGRRGCRAPRAARQRVSARDHFLRASMYYRSAEYFADPFGRTAQQWGCASREAFVKAAAHMAERVEAVEISFEGKALPGYFMTPAARS